MASPGRPRSKPAAVLAPASPDRWRNLLLLAALLLATLLAYYPAWHGGLLWDDDAHVTRPELQAITGLWRIWFELGATQQYYPLVHSAFWIQHALWGDSTFGYHLVNIALHSTSAFLLVLVLRRLKVPGAALAGAVFALHPVQVESVAWITELKNTLSGTLYLGAALAYLRFDRSRESRSYVTALGLFALALLSKSVTATLPVALLVVFWWQRGRLEVRKDVAPLVPWMALGAASGLMTAWIERTFIGAQGADFGLSLIERGLLASRALAFYASKVVWPVKLIFLYPRWTVSQAVWWQYGFPIAVAIAAGVSWKIRHRTRAPLAALLFFSATLFPALGFLNVYPFRYSFVADHFQYLACIGIITPVVAGVMRAASRWTSTANSVAQVVFAAALLLPLGILTYRQSRQYVSAETLYLTTLERNPSSWLAQENLGVIALHRSPSLLEEAARRFQAAISINPNDAQVHNNLGTTWMQMGRLDEALTEHQTAVRLAPGYAEAYHNMGAVLQKLGRLDEAAAAYRIALDIKPQLAGARFNLGVVLQAKGDPEESNTLLQKTVEAEPRNIEAHEALGDSLLRLGRPSEAIDRYRAAVAINPADPTAHAKLGTGLSAAGRFDEAAVEYQEAVRLNPDSTGARNDLGVALLRLGRVEEAAAQVREVLQRRPRDAAAHDTLGNILQARQKPQEALAEYRLALEADPGPNQPEIHNDFGVALARVGRLPEAIDHFREALRLRPDFPAAQANLTKALAVK